MNTSNITEKISIAVAAFMGGMGIIALCGIIFKAGKIPETTMTVLASVVTASLSGLPSLLAKLSSTPERPADVNIVNPKSDPVPTTDVKPPKSGS